MKKLLSLLSAAIMVVSPTISLVACQDANHALQDESFDLACLNSDKIDGSKLFLNGNGTAVNSWQDVIKQAIKALQNSATEEVKQKLMAMTVDNVDVQIEETNGAVLSQNDFAQMQKWGKEHRFTVTFFAIKNGGADSVLFTNQTPALSFLWGNIISSLIQKIGGETMESTHPTTEIIADSDVHGMDWKNAVGSDISSVLSRKFGAELEAVGYSIKYTKEISKIEKTNDNGPYIDGKVVYNVVDGSGNKIANPFGLTTDFTFNYTTEIISNLNYSYNQFYKQGDDDLGRDFSIYDSQLEAFIRTILNMIGVTGDAEKTVSKAIGSIVTPLLAEDKGPIKYTYDNVQTSYFINFLKKQIGKENLQKIWDLIPKYIPVPTGNAPTANDDGFVNGDGADWHSFMTNFDTIMYSSFPNVWKGLGDFSTPLFTSKQGDYIELHLLDKDSHEPAESNAVAQVGSLRTIFDLISPDIVHFKNFYNWYCAKLKAAQPKPDFFSLIMKYCSAPYKMQFSYNDHFMDSSGFLGKGGNLTLLLCHLIGEVSNMNQAYDDVGKFADVTSTYWGDKPWGGESTAIPGLRIVVKLFPMNNGIGVRTQIIEALKVEQWFQSTFGSFINGTTHLQMSNGIYVSFISDSLLGLYTFNVNPSQIWLPVAKKYFNNLMIKNDADNKNLLDYEQFIKDYDVTFRDDASSGIFDIQYNSITANDWQSETYVGDKDGNQLQHVMSLDPDKGNNTRVSLSNPLFKISSQLDKNAYVWCNNTLHVTFL